MLRKRAAGSENVQAYQGYLGFARWSLRALIRRRSDPEIGGAVPIHVFLEAWFHRRPVARSKKIGTTLTLEFHTRKV
jgi:hypothetical protein